MSESVNNPTQNKAAGALNGDEVVEVQRGQWAPKFKTSTGAIGSLGKSVVVTDGATTITNAATINFTAGGTVSSGGAGVADVAISGGGAPTIAAHSLFGNPGTAAAAGTNVSVGTGLTLTAGGSLEAAGGGGGFTPQQTFITSSQMLTPPVGATFMEINAAVGGAGAGANGDTAAGGGGGGGGGQFTRQKFKISDLPAAPWAVTIGGGGVAPSGSGSQTAVGTFCVANYGYGGSGTAGGLGAQFGSSYPGFPGNGGAGGNGGTTDLGRPGDSGLWAGGGGGGGGGVNAGQLETGGNGGIGNNFNSQTPGGSTDGANGSASSALLVGQGYALGGGGGANSMAGKGGNGSTGQYGGGGGGGGGGPTIGNGADGMAGYVRAIFT